LRKVCGLNAGGLIKQFFIESLLYSCLSFVIGLLLAWLLLPYFNTLASKSLTMPWASGGCCLLCWFRLLLSVL